ncbi:hypothetical protein BpHYR1_034199 [Brachionus plicatilis]|uniref:Uncharacterized protein n=1 Tax=Brachionus plicatilis TaxID=10195 RepID=A0A3M7RVX3_BRAPC|nr:hypothetical protein BpHYR1_034199 [Brachionus plicatilis]
MIVARNKTSKNQIGSREPGLALSNTDFNLQRKDTLSFPSFFVASNPILKERQSKSTLLCF